MAFVIFGLQRRALIREKDPCTCRLLFAPPLPKLPVAEMPRAVAGKFGDHFFFRYMLFSEARKNDHGER